MLYTSIGNQAMLKQPKLSNQLSAIDQMEKRNAELHDMITKLENEVRRGDTNVSDVAKNKVERIMKKGTVFTTLKQYTNIVESSKRSKYDEGVKIDNMNDILNQKVELFSDDIDRKIDILKQKKQAFIDQSNIKIQENKQKKEIMEAKYDKTIAHHEPLIERCYEDPVVDLAPTPSHLKKAALLKEYKSDFENNKNLIMVMMKAELAESSFNKIDPEEIERKKRRDMARAEDNQRLKESQAAQYDTEIAEAIQRKAAVKAEEDRAKNNRNMNVVVQPKFVSSEEFKKKQARDLQEYRRKRQLEIDIEEARLRNLNDPECESIKSFVDSEEESTVL